MCELLDLLAEFHPTACPEGPNHTHHASSFPATATRRRTGFPASHRVNVLLLRSSFPSLSHLLASLPIFKPTTCSPDEMRA